MISKLKSVKRAIRLQGLLGLNVVIANKLYSMFHHPINTTKYHNDKIPVYSNLIVNPSDVVSIDADNKYRAPGKLKKQKLSIAWVSLNIGIGGGGHLNMVRFMRYLQSRGHDVSFYVYGSQSGDEAHYMLNKYYGIDVKCRNINDFHETPDVIIATSWDSAYAVFNIHVKNIHKFYFVQDFEPMFYGVGSRYKLAEKTYRFGFYGITAGKWLAIRVSEYGMKADYYNFGVDLDLYRPKRSGDFHKKKRVLFYARPETERRGFELGIMSLSIFIKQHPDYEIAMIGQDVSMYDIPFKYINLGKFDNLNSLADVYHESIACLVISLTNVSLLPLELLAAGCVPVMNTGDNNTMVLGGVDGIEYSDILPTNIAKSISNTVERSDIEQHAKDISNGVKNRSWEDSYKKVESIILRETTENDKK